MLKHVKRIPLYLILGAIAIFLIVWGGALLRCEILTHHYHADFETAWQSNSMVDSVEHFKVLQCDISYLKLLSFFLTGNLWNRNCETTLLSENIKGAENAISNRTGC